jgi:DNA-directed RNA polymerase subunit K/omega
MAPEVYMIYPPLEELTQGGKYSRYEIVSVVAKCARKVTEEYVTQREYAEKLIANKDTDKSLASLIKNEYRNEKAVRTAINRIYEGEYRIAEDSAKNNCED